MLISKLMSIIKEKKRITKLKVGGRSAVIKCNRFAMVARESAGDPRVDSHTTPAILEPMKSNTTINRLCFMDRAAHLPGILRCYILENL